MMGPRLLLFGTPGAGKSALLAALVQAVPALKAELIDESQVAQRFQVQPSEKEKVSGRFSSEVTVLDCSGKAALEMLKAPQPFANSHPMKKPILEADAMVFAVDVSAPKKQMNEEFRQCARWLRQLHEFRGQRTDIAALPVFVALTKCDLLVQKQDSFETWKKRLDEGKRQYDENFRKYLKQHGAGFGTIQLKVVATAIKQPAFTDKPAKAQEPFGVAELFRECLQSASDFQDRRHTAQTRLQNVVAGLLGTVTLLALSVAFLIEFQPPPKGTTLDEKVQLALPKPSATPIERLHGTVKKLEEKEKKLAEIAGDAGFERLPSETQKEITLYREEISQYLQLYQQSQEILKLPHLAKNDDELKELGRKVLEFSFPDARAKDWQETRLGRRLREVRAQYEAFDAAVKSEEAWIRVQIEKNDDLLEQGNEVYGRLLKRNKNAPDEAKQWSHHYRDLMNSRPPTPRDDNVPGVSRVIYEDLGKFEPVKTAQKEWKASKENLTSIADLIQKKLKAGS
jgi:GTPase SAR1 family protein